MATMGLSNFGYSLHEAGSHFKRNWSTALGAIVTIFLSLFIIGLFILGSALIENMVGSVENRVTIQAFLSDDADQAAVTAFQQEVQGWDTVESVTYKSYRNASDAVSALDGQNPIPASLVIKLKDPKDVQDVAQRIASSSSFAAIADNKSNPSGDVQYGRETVERLFSVTAYIRIGAIGLVGLLVFVAFVFINNTIRLAINARRREIAIMRLVGASNSFIRGPFLMEGVLEALIGALLAIVVLVVGAHMLLPVMAESMTFLTFAIPTTVMLGMSGLLLLLGLLLGLFGSAIAMGRYLKA